MALVPRNSRPIPLGELNHLSGLVISNNVSDVNNDIDVAVGRCADSTNSVNIQLTSVITKRLDANWVIGTNQGGLDTGSKTLNSTYHVYLIMNTATNIADMIFSTSAVGPLLPTGYNYFRRIGSITTNASNNIRQFNQVGNEFYLVGGVDGYNATHGAVNVDTPLTGLPLGITVDAFGTALAVTNSSGVQMGMYIGAAGVTPPTPTNATAPLSTGQGTIRATTSGSAVVGQNTQLFAYSSGFWRCRAVNGSVRIISSSSGVHFVNIAGYTDNRGKS